MLRDELLRPKNDEIARCLLSRKRKLSELYFATVGFPGTNEGTPQSDLYRQKEAAFLDANDLTKGRFYNENTLPPRSDRATVTIPLESAQANAKHVETRSSRGTDTNQDGFRPNQAVSLAVSDSNSPRPDAVAVAVAHKLSVQSPPVPADGPVGSKVASNSPPSSLPVKPAIRANELINGPNKPDDVEKYNENGLQTTATHLDYPVPSDNPIHNPPAPLHAHEEPSTAPNHGAHVSVVVPPKPEAVSSPVSSGPSSTHTSATERSPASSSTESIGSIADSGALHKVKGERHLSASSQPTPIPNAIPSTPDEQLKLEAAMSIQNSVPNRSLVHGDLSDFRQPPQQLVNTKVPHPEDDRASNEISQMEVDLKTVNPLETDGGRSQSVASLRSDNNVPATGALEPRDLSIGASSGTSKRMQSEPAAEQQTQPERMTTRVSSGAIRHKSVSEILGETPRQSVKPGIDRQSRESSRSGSVDTSHDSSSRLRLKDRQQKEKERSKLSTVVFPKPPTPGKDRSMEMTRHKSGHQREIINEEEDYLYTLFQAKAHYPPRTMSLNSLLTTAHKTLTTSNHFLEYHEQMDCRTLKRIYQLQHSNRWALRQLQRSPEPSRSATHWDIMLDHMKWMRMDFREERKWKIAAAKRCADWCAEYVASDSQHRTLLRVPVRQEEIQKETVDDNDKSELDRRIEIQTDDPPNNHPTPDLIPSADDDSASDGFNEDFQPDLEGGNVPAAIFSMGSDEFTFRMEKTLASEKILGELPFYSPVQIVPETKLPSFKTPPDVAWKTEILPVSKYASGSIQFKEEGPPRKRSRYDYAGHSDDNDSDTGIDPILPEQNNVALFLSEFKHIRDRIHPNHSFRPPTEYLMPPLGFYESRQSSQWTCIEDGELRRLVREYSYNWSLISSCLASRSKFTSGAERRTPWECFERWIGLEGLPADMAKTPYFRAYSSRLEAAQRSVLAAQQQAIQQQQQQQQAGNQQSTPTPQALIRRRTTQPVRVERKRSSRHLALLAGMRKLSQKREALVQKQQHATHLASLRKANEANQPRPPISTPAEFSRLKHERELKYQEKQEQYRQQILAHQRAALAQRVAQQQPTQQQQQPINGVAGRNPVSMPANGVTPGIAAPLPNGVPNGVPTSGAVNPSRPHPAMQGIPNGIPANGALAPGGMPMKMMPQPGLQQPINGRPGLPLQTSPDNARIIREANRLQEQQRLVQSRQQQQQQQHQFHGQQPFVQQPPQSSPNMNTPVTANQNNPALMAAFQAASGVGSPSFHAPALVPGVSSASPRINPNTVPNPQAMPTINSIQNSVQRSHPNMPQDQANKIANERLQQYQQQRLSQAALNAAAGNIGSMPGNAYQLPRDANAQQLPQSNVPNGGTPMPNSQAQGYSPLLRVAQPNQPNRLAVSGSPAMNGMVMQQSRSATPQTHRTGSSQGNTNTTQGKSPRPPQAQMASS